MKRVEPYFKEGYKFIAAVLHKKSIFRSNEYQQFCRLGGNTQVLKQKAWEDVLWCLNLCVRDMVIWLIHIYGNLIV